METEATEHCYYRLVVIFMVNKQTVLCHSFNFYVKA